MINKKFFWACGYTGSVTPVGFNGRLRMLSRSMLWPQGTDPNEIPSNDQIIKILKTATLGTHIGIDHIEAWNLDEPNRAASLANLIALLGRCRTLRPDLIYGLYKVAPGRNYWASITGPKSSTYADWIKANQDYEQLSNAIDISLPSLYTFYDKQQLWKLYAKEHIHQARRYLVPVYPFICPEYHVDNEALKGTWLGTDYWRLQMELCYKYADGFVIWTPQGKTWDQKWPWVIETYDFMQHILG